MSPCKAYFFRVSITVVLFALAPIVIRAEALGENRTQVLAERVKDIEDLAIMDRAGIKNQYRIQLTAHVARQRRNVERLVQTFATIERVLWIELIRAHQGRDNPAGGLVDIPAPGFWKGHKAFQREIADSYSFKTLTEILMEADSLHVLMEIAASPHHPLSLRRTAENVLHLLGPSTQATARLALEKEARLRLVDQWEAFRKECLLTEPTYGAASNAKGDETGLLAIVHDDTHGYGCFLRGSDALLRKGDRVGEIAVINIAEAQVTFERRGDRWTESIED